MASQKPKGKANYSRKPKRGFQKTEKTEEVRSQKFNDPKWYTAAGQLPVDVGSLSFNNALGVDVRFVPEDGTTPNAETYNYGGLPGIFVIHTVPAVGYAPNSIAGVNIASKNIYSWVRHQNSGHSNYDSPDLMLYLLAMDQVYSCLAWMTRVYGVARVFSQTNRYIGKALLTAMGVDAEDIYSHLSDFRAFINMAIIKAGSMCVPAIMTYMIRHVWMYSNVYKDEDISKASLYMYNPATFWQLNTEGSTNLKPLSILGFNSAEGFQNRPATDFTVNGFRLLFNQLMDPIIADEDMNIMSGDILKAFGRENLFGMAMIPEDYSVIPVYSEEVLEQIHNTSFVGNQPVNLSNAISLEKLGIIQDTAVGSGNLIFQPGFKTAYVHAFTHVLDFYKENITPEDVIVASRNLVTGYNGFTQDGAYYNTTITSCGSEICLFATVYRFQLGVLANPQAYYTNSSAVMGNTTYSVLQKFNWAPIALAKSASTQTTFNVLVGDMGNYTLIHHNEIQKLHDTAILSMFGVPLLGNINNR